MKSTFQRIILEPDNYSATQSLVYRCVIIISLTALALCYLITQHHRYAWSNQGVFVLDTHTGQTINAVSYD